MSAAARPQPLTLATPCVRPGCGHPYNWHVPGPRCTAGPDSAPCPCAAFQAPADTAEGKTVPEPLKPERRKITYEVEPGAPDGYPVWKVSRRKGNNSNQVADYTSEAAAGIVAAALNAAAEYEDR